jgi:hypothetical protein
MRVLAVLTACWLLLHATGARGDVQVTVGIRQLGSDPSQRVRLAAALGLAKTRDPRAVIALAGALRNDADDGIRRVAALALSKMIDARTPPDAVALAFTALDDAAANDRSADVQVAASNTALKLASYRPVKKTKAPSGRPGKAGGPPVFVNIDATTDQSKQLPPGGGDRLKRIVMQNVQRTGLATTWPGGLPTSNDLSASRSKAFIVASTVKKIDITKTGAQTQIACTVAVRVAPWTGSDGGERWEANRAASASGSAKAIVGNRPRDVQAGVNDCLEAVAEDVTSRQVVPFLKRLASASP